MPQLSSATPHDDRGGRLDPARAASPLSRWPSVRHPRHTEAAVVLALYGLYEVARGLVVGNAAQAERHARHLAATERSLHLLVEAKLQSAVHVLPGLRSLLAAAYVTPHVAVTAGGSTVEGGGISRWKWRHQAVCGYTPLKPQVLGTGSRDWIDRRLAS